MSRRAPWMVGATVAACVACAAPGVLRAEDEALPATVDETLAAPAASVETAPPPAVPSPARVAARVAARHARRAPAVPVVQVSAAQVAAAQAAQAMTAPASAAGAASPASAPSASDDTAWTAVQKRASDLAARGTRPSRALQHVIDTKGNIRDESATERSWWEKAMTTVTSLWPRHDAPAPVARRAPAHPAPRPAAVAAAPVTHPATTAPAAHAPVAAVASGTAKPSAPATPRTARAAHVVAASVTPAAPAAPPAPSQATAHVARRAAAAHAARPAKPLGPPAPPAVSAAANAPAQPALGKRLIPPGAELATAPSVPKAPATTREWQQRTGTTRDPFVSLVSGTFEGEESTPIFDVGELRLVGVLWGQTDRFALVENVSGKGTALRAGDRLVNGYVDSITPTSLTLVETGPRGSRKIILHMKEDDNGTRMQ